MTPLAACSPYLSTVASSAGSSSFDTMSAGSISRTSSSLMRTDAGTGFMHESFDVNDPEHFTREWFAWQNTLFGELILKIVNDGKTDLLNSIN